MMQVLTRQVQKGPNNMAMSEHWDLKKRLRGRYACYLVSSHIEIDMVFHLGQIRSDLLLTRYTTERTIRKVMPTMTSTTIASTVIG